MRITQQSELQISDTVHIFCLSTYFIVEVAYDPATFTVTRDMKEIFDYDGAVLVKYVCLLYATLIF